MINSNRPLSLLLLLAWYGLLGLLFLVIRPELAYTYGQQLLASSLSLPHLTHYFSLPALGASADPLDSSGLSVTFLLFWAIQLIPPGLIYFLSGGQEEQAGPGTPALLWSAIYLVIFSAGWLLILFGLWLPHSLA